MTGISLLDVASYLPPNQVPLEYFANGDDTLRDSLMFRAPQFRRHVAPDESAVDMIERAVQPLIDRHGPDAIRDVDIVITHVQLPDLPFSGCGTEVLRRLGCRPEYLLDLHNGGCAAMLHAVKLARELMRTGGARSALVCVVQNSAGQVFAQPEVRGLPQAPIPGDGCGVAYLVASDESPVLDVECRHYGEAGGDMVIEAEGRKYWEAGESQLRVGFTEAKIAKVLERGNRIVPEVAQEVCRRIEVPSTELDILITNQPNRTFLRNWREALQLAPQRHLDTFGQYGNLFAAAMPITLDEAISDGRVKPGSLVMLAGFAHAGDFAAAAAVRWQGR
ncbi:3-oxoacyl-ACP synthase III family protein [Streptomyces sp. NPDC057910]|uniref:3-oxoacyl-ACP synthase III family protein n=1 Tax=Streptomyces sp. NPDC057910 TaxID=3346278 RepID=UPI0036E098B4